jgi:hypothetical protein
MSKRIAVCFMAILLLALPSFSGDKKKLDTATAVQLISEQQGDDLIIGLWNGAAGGYSWQTAIVKNPDHSKDGYEFVGLLVRPWPFFKKGEAHIYLNKTGAAGVYEGKEKWKSSFFFGSWSSARFYLTGANQLVQSNNIGFSTPLGSDWTLLRQPVVSQQTTQSLPLKKAGNELSTATIASQASQDVVQSVLFVWFDEEPPQPGAQVIEAVVTARAYEGVLTVLREVRGANTAVKSGFSVLETNFHPPTFQLGQWISQQSSPEKLTSVFYWEDELLGETTPVMNFYMTRRAYESVIAVVQQYFAGIRKSQQLPSEKEKRLNGFLSVLGTVAQGALQGMANYYTTVRPVEQQQLALEQAVAAQRSQAYAAQQQVWELQKLNQQIDQLNTQRFLDQLQRNGEQYSRMLQRFSTGTWSH